MATLTTKAKISTVRDMLSRAELVKVSYTQSAQASDGGTPCPRIVVRGGNRDMKAALRDPSPENPARFPSIELRKGEFELEFGGGDKSVRITNRVELGLRLEGGDEDPEFQVWLDRQIEKIGMRAVINRSQAVQWFAVGGNDHPTAWTAILEPSQVGLTTVQRESVPALVE